MHWFWRAMLALIPGSALGIWIHISLSNRNGLWHDVISSASGAFGWFGVLVLFAVLSLPIVVSLGVYSALVAGHRWLRQACLGATATLASMCLVTFVLILVHWMLSYHRFDEVDWWWGSRHFIRVQTERGLIRIERGNGCLYPTSPFYLEYHGFSPTQWSTLFDVLRPDFDFREFPSNWQFGSFAVRGFDSTTWACVVFPHWFPVVLLGGSSLLLIRRQRSLWRRNRISHGLCQRCAYDLRSNTSGICPECGQPLERGQTG